MDKYDLDNRFKHHPPTRDSVANFHNELRARCRDLAEFLDNSLPDSREKSTALTSLEEMMHWGNACAARYQMP